MKKPYSIVVTGVDASGKDTQTERLAKALELRGLKTRVVSVWDCFALFQGRAEPAKLQTILQTFLVDFDPLPRSLFLQSILAQAVQFVRSRKDLDVVIFNGFAPKYWASELVYGAPDSVWDHAVTHALPHPDLVYVLTCPVAVCESRRTQWSPYESGEAKSDSRDKMNRHEFQTRLNEQLTQVMNRCEKIWAPKDGTHWIAAEGSEESVFQKILSHLPNLHAHLENRSAEQMV